MTNPNAPGARTAYPTADDLLNLLEQAGMKTLAGDAFETLISRVTAALQSYVQASIDEFEQRTGFLPFLAGTRDQDGNRVTTPTTTTRYYTPSGPERNHHTFGTAVVRGGGRMIEIDGGLLQVDSITTGLTYDETGAPANGTARVVHRDCTLRPENALQMGQPYEIIEFYAPLYGMARSIRITGLFGYCSRLPEDVWQAILGGAAVQMQAQCGLVVTEGVSKVKLDNGIDVQFAGDALETHFKPWAAKFDRTVSRYLREDVGL